ncbi:MAG: TolC family protein [Bacteroidetes bacterium]|nr:MAG: TolC family protein [Bacteroidota bacterium]
MNKKYSLLLLITVFVLPLLGQMRFNLKQAITYGQEHSPSARSIKAAYSSAEWNYVASRSALLPSLSLQGNVPGFVRSISQIQQPNGDISFREQRLASSSLSMMLSQNVTPTGGSIFMSSDLSRIDLLGTNPTTTWQASPLQVGFTQPLFRVNNLRWDWKQAKLQYEFAKKQATESLEDLSIAITTAFFDYYIVRKQMINAEYNVAMNDTFYRIAEGRYSVGKIAENEKLQAELSLMNAQNMRDQIQIQILTTEKRLKNLLGVPDNQRVDVDYEESLPLYTVSLEKALAEARENRSNYVGFKIQETDAELNVRRAMANRRFNGDLTMSFGLTNTSAQFNDAYNNLQDAQRLTVGFSMPILNFGRNKAAYMVAKNDKESRMAQIENNRNSLELEIMNNVLQFNQLKQILAISAKSDTIARQRYDISTKRFVLGKIDLTNLTIAQNEKDQALINYIRNLQNFWVSYYQLRRLTLFDFETGNKILVQ